MFFFFQAEDGIRDYKVTGVQTCALPISSRRGAPEPRGPCWSSPKPVPRAARARRRRWASRPGTSRSPASAASGYPASRPAINPGRSPAPARGSRLTPPRAAGFSTGPPQTERLCTREWWMSGAQAWWSASGYSRSRAADLCGRRIHEKPDNVKRERCTTASREDVAHGSARRLRATSLLDDVLCYAIARCLLACSARGLRSRPWSRGADPRHSDRDRLRAGLPGVNHPDDLRKIGRAHV